MDNPKNFKFSRYIDSFFKHSSFFKKSIASLEVLLLLVLPFFVFLPSKQVLAQSYTLTLQPDSTTGSDNALSQASPTTNYGASVTAFATGEPDNSATGTNRMLVKFDLSGIPDGSTITSATLTITQWFERSSNVRTLRVYRMKQAWTEMGSTWNKYDGTNNWPGGAGGFGLSDCEQTDIGSRTFSATETSGAKDFILNPVSKEALDLGNGWMIKADTELDDAYFFRPSEQTVETERPKLVINYSVPDVTLDTPTNVNSSLTNNIPTITWTKSANATNYEIYRGTSTAPTTLLTSVGDVGAYTDNTVYTGGTYYYRLRAVADGYNKSNYSSETSQIIEGPLPAYYVDFDSGLDTNNGVTPYTPWKHCPGDVNATGVAGSTILDAGDNIVFKGGVTYLGTVGLNWSGTADDSRIIYDGNSSGNWGTGKAIIDGGNTRYYGFNGASRDYITLRNFEVRNIAHNAGDITANRGIALDGGTGITIQNNYIHDIGYWQNDSVKNPSGRGIQISTPINCNISGNEITKTGYSGIMLLGPTNCSINNNSIHDYVNWGIDISSDYSQAINNIITNNTIHDLYRYDCGPGGNPDFWPNDGVACNTDGSVKDPNLHPHSDFIFLRKGGGTLGPANNIIEKNFFYNDKTFTNSDGTAQLYISLSAGNTIRNNLFINPHSYNSVRIGASDKFYNNTVYSPRTQGIYLADTGAVIKNNIIACSTLCLQFLSTAVETSVVSDYNLYYKYGSFARTDSPFTNYTDLTNWQTARSQDLHSTVLGTLDGLGLANVSSYPGSSSLADLKIISSSPAVNAGIDTATDSNVPLLDKDGNSRVAATDIGAYEYHIDPTYDITQPNTNYTENGVTISFIDTLPDGATGVNISVTALDSTTHTLPGGKTLIKLYNITATNQDGQEVTEGFNAHITLDYPAAKDSDEANYTIMYWNGTSWSTDGITNMQVDTGSNKISFDTTHFSEYAILGQITGNVGNNNENTPTMLPRTGSDTLIITIVALLVSFLTPLVSIVTRRRFQIR